MTAQTSCLLLYISKNHLNFNGYNLLIFCLNIEIEKSKGTFILFNRTVTPVRFAFIVIECSFCIQVECCTKKKVSMIRTNPRYREEEPQNAYSHKTSEKQ